MYRILIAALFLISNPTLASAWGDTGHKIGCEITFRLALPEVRAEIRRLMKGEDHFFREACIFPDHPRTRDKEHYVNLARTAKGIAATSPCPLAPKCVLSAIESDMAVLASSTNDERKLTALKYLGH
ncbi:hypothetical protein EOW77_0034360 [Bradyrhizobium yuanmingense]|nr:hypothetical protein EOW77_0034360 [Bradyrhizobium yuanmingense]